MFLFGMLVLAWPIAAYNAHPAIGKDWTLHNLGRFQGELHGFKHPLYYFYSLPAFALPWSLFWIPGAIRCLRNPGPWRSLGRFIACCVVPALIVLSLAAFKRKHYALPVLPCMTLLATVGVSQCATWFYHRPLRQYALPALFSTTWTVVVALHGFYAPGRDSYLGQTQLAARINASLPAEEPLYLVNMPENQITYYLRGKLVRHDKFKQFADYLAAAQPRSIFVLLPQDRLNRLQPLGDIELLDCCQRAERHTPESQRLTLARLSSSRDLPTGQLRCQNGTP
jgi:hypothetical protein